MMVFATVINELRVSFDCFVARAATLTKESKIALLTIWALVLPVKLVSYEREQICFKRNAITGKKRLKIST